MLELHEELLNIADHMEQLSARGHCSEIQQPIESIKLAAEKIDKAWSGSWIGYHANVYYYGLVPPPPGAHFSSEWGLTLGQDTSGDWVELSTEEVKNAVLSEAGHPDLDLPRRVHEEIVIEFETNKSNIFSILEIANENFSDTFLSNLKKNLEQLSILSKNKLIGKMSPNGQIMSRDSLALTQGLRTPPHILVLSDALVMQHTFKMAKSLSSLAKKAGTHLLRRRQRQSKLAETGATKIFIGHGQSPIWRELKDFIQEKLKLPVDEFNRVPVAGKTNTVRLSEMMDTATFAFLVMTGEDEQPSGKLHARMNVVHEAGLFQGKLGFRRAIVLLEENCEEFSNIEGLGHIRFPAGKIKHAFEEIREVLEREGVLAG